MAITPYLAMTAEELRQNPKPPTAIAWMACHFSPYGTGLSNLPDNLPAYSLLILNDRIPPHRHNPEQIVAQLSKVIGRFPCAGLLLDFQQPLSPETEILVRRLLTLPCPVAVTPTYAAGKTCPVFLPPCPPHVAPDIHLAPWFGREIWLDLSPGWETATVTKEGTRFKSCKPTSVPTPFEDKALFCRYGISLTEDAAVFTLFRDTQDLSNLLKKAGELGVTRAIGLYQELFDAEKTAPENPERS